MTATYIHTQRNNHFLKTVLKSLAWLYLAVVVAALVYLWCFTQDRFVSTAVFEVTKSDSSSAATGVAQLVLPGLTSTGTSDAQVVIGFINSADLLLELEKEFDLARHYSSPKTDIVFRLPADYTLEERLDYYRKRIVAHYDIETCLTSLTVETFDRELSRKVADAVLKKAEAFENRLNQSVADQQMGFSKEELDRACKHVEELNKQLLTLQNQYKVVTPDAAITANLAAISQLQLNRLNAAADLATVMRDSPGSPKIEIMRSQLRSLDELINSETAKLSGPEQDRLNQILLEFKELQTKLDFAVSQRTSALMVVEKNRVTAASRSMFLSVIQKPYLPEFVSIPQRWYATATIICLAFLVFLIFRALTQSIFEKA